MTENKKIVKRGTAKRLRKNASHPPPNSTNALEDPASFISHKLESQWEFWMHKPMVGTSDEAYTASLQHFPSFGSVEDFWAQFAHISQPSQIVSSDPNPKVKGLSLFRKDVGPKWEHPKNNGQKITFKTNSNHFGDEIWREIVLALVGEMLPSSELVSGVRFAYTPDKNKRFFVYRMELWTSINDNLIIKAIEDHVMALSSDRNKFSSVSYGHQK